jgi:hypothetical protein
MSWALQELTQSVSSVRILTKTERPTALSRDAPEHSLPQAMLSSRVVVFITTVNGTSVSTGSTDELAARA